MNYATAITGAFNNALTQFGMDNNIGVFLNMYDETADTSIPYLAGAKLPSGVTPGALGFSDIRGGIFQIDINYEKGLGELPLTEMFDLLNETFYAGACFLFGGVCVNILSYEDGPTIRTDSWATMSTTITYDAYTAKL